MPPRLNDSDGPGDPKKIELARKLRREQSPVERKLWWIVRDRRLAGYKFRRQFPIGKYFADFCCYERKLIVEVDGIQHENTFEADQQREQFLRAAGFRVLRFWGTEICRDQPAVLERIVNFLGM